MALHLPEETLKQVWTSLDALCERSAFSIDAFITVGGFESWYFKAETKTVVNLTLQKIIQNDWTW